MHHYIFTITAGRTGTAWIADLMANNLVIKAVHEPLEIDDFGINMPDIKIMRSFNERGFNSEVQQFWQNKFANLESYPVYFESNHSLAKCGLVEHCAGHQQKNKITFLCIRRDYVTLCKSYIDRGDFDNMTVCWQWYLDHKYRNKIVDPAALLEITEAGPVIWYAFEMEARQEYYKILYGDQFQFVDLSLETMTTQANANKLIDELNGSTPARLPPARNQNLHNQDDLISSKLTEIFMQIDFDPVIVAQDYIDQGHRLG